MIFKKLKRVRKHFFCCCVTSETMNALTFINEKREAFMQQLLHTGLSLSKCRCYTVFNLLIFFKKYCGERGTAQPLDVKKNIDVIIIFCQQKNSVCVLLVVMTCAIDFASNTDNCSFAQMWKDAEPSLQKEPRASWGAANPGCSGVWGRVHCQENAGARLLT